MPTKKRRINLTIDMKLFKALEILARQQQESLSHVSLSLIEKAIELMEDFHFSGEADERLTKKEKRISHKKAWG